MSGIDISSQRGGNRGLFSPPTREHKLIFSYFCLCALVLVHFLPASWSNDAITVLGIANGEIDSEDSGSYYLTALIFGALGDFSILFILIIGYFWAGELSYYVANRMTVFVLIFSTMPGVLMGLIRPQKDVFIGFVVFWALYCFRRYRENPSRLFLNWAILFFVYGLTMRPYYVLIFLLFLLISAAERYFRLWVMSVLFLLFLLSLMLSQEQMVLLQGARDGVNFVRGVDEEQRTAFGNLYPYIENIFQFWANYFYAFIYLNFPVVNYFDIPAVALQMSILLYVFLMWKCFYFFSGSSLKYVGILFLSNFLFFPLFEPDLGSYARHISLASAYLSPVIMAAFYVSPFKKGAV